MARDGTNRGGRRVRAGDKPAPAAEKIQKGQQVQILKNDIPTLSPSELEAVDLPEGAVMNGVDMPKPSDYLSARQKNGIPRIDANSSVDTFIFDLGNVLVR